MAKLLLFKRKIVRRNVTMMPTFIARAKKKKIKKKLDFILRQRAGVGTAGPHRIRLADLKKHIKLVKTKERS